MLRIQNSLILHDTRLYLFSPCNARLSRVVEEATLLYELAEVGFQDTVQFVGLSPLHILMVVEVHHFHRCYML